MATEAMNALRHEANATGRVKLRVHGERVIETFWELPGRSIYTVEWREGGNLLDAHEVAQMPYRGPGQIVQGRDGRKEHWIETPTGYEYAGLLACTKEE